MATAQGVVDQGASCAGCDLFLSILSKTAVFPGVFVFLLGEPTLVIFLYLPGRLLFLLGYLLLHFVIVGCLLIRLLRSWTALMRSSPR